MLVAGVIETSCPGDPSFPNEHSPVEWLFQNHPENNSLLAVAIILHVLLTEAYFLNVSYLLCV